MYDYRPLITAHSFSKGPYEAYESVGRIRHPEVGPGREVKVSHDSLRISLKQNEFLFLLRS